MDRRIAVGLGVVGALAAGATGTWYVLRDDEPSVPPRTVTTLPPPTAPATTEAGVAGAVEFAIDDGATLSTDRTLTLSLQAPSDVTDVQVSTDPGFHAATWTPVAPSVEFEVPDVGYQMVFVRGRIGSGEPGPVRVAGIDVDERWDAATASAGEGRHRPSYAQLLAPDVLQVRIETGRVTNDDGDKVVVGDDLVLGRLFETGGYVFGGPGGAGLTVLAANPITRPAGSIGYDPPYPVVHDWVLELSAPVPVGQEIELSFLDDVDPISFTIDPTSTRSPSVQVNQVGFAPGDGGKLAFVGAWGGWAGPIELPDGMAFRVIDDATDEVVLTGTTVARTPGPNGDWGKGDLTGTAVQAADFSSLTTEGRYRVCVDVLGCSPSFDIGVDDTWRRALVAAGRAMYHQRSGIALGPPYTSIVRPRPFHPDDGVQFERVTLTMLDRLDNVGVDDRFDEYPDAVTGELVPDVWGGHFDAGDWNMRIQHLSYLEAALDLVELFPEYFADLELGIPESGDAVPDVIDEGLWDLDLFRRLQSADGGVAGAVDQVSFANEGETSWDNGLRVFVYSPDVWSTYWYAAAAARTAIVLETYDPERAATYASSAQRAMDWAEQTWAADPARAERAAAVEPRRAAAATAMLQLTGDARYDQIFLEASPFDTETMPLLDCPGPLCDAAWRYARLPDDLVTDTARQHAIDSFVQHADALVSGQQSSAYPFLIERPDLPLIWGLGPGVPHGIAILRAHLLTGDESYRTAAVLGASFSLGGNPLGTSFATGLGSDPARSPLIVDTMNGDLPVWPGSFVFGPHNLLFDGSDDWIENELRLRNTRPDPLAVPLLWSWYDVNRWVPMSEFMVERSHTSALWTLGVLAATASS